MNGNGPTADTAALTLSLLKPHSPAQLYRTLRQCGSALSVLADPDRLIPLLCTDSQRSLECYLRLGSDSPLGAEIQTILGQLKTLDARLVAFGHQEYPQLLANAHDAPPLLFVRGNADALHLPAIAIVGARHCTAQGGENAERFAAELAANGFAIVSGLAAGIDGCAHRGALLAKGITCGVMATGIDRIYPQRHRQLAEEILVNDGCLVSEMPLGSKPLRAHFPQRNRIISGLSLGVLVVEAKIKSGSLITARTATAQNREVFAIPGSIHNPMSRGCHELIRNGAKLVESTSDIVEELGGLLAFKQRELFDYSQSSTGVEHPILDALGYEAKTLDELAEATDYSVDELLVEILNLELAGDIIQIDGRVERIFS